MRPPLFRSSTALLATLAIAALAPASLFAHAAPGGPNGSIVAHGAWTYTSSGVTRALGDEQILTLSWSSAGRHLAWSFSTTTDAAVGGADATYVHCNAPHGSTGTGTFSVPRVDSVNVTTIPQPPG